MNNFLKRLLFRCSGKYGNVFQNRRFFLLFSGAIAFITASTFLLQSHLSLDTAPNLTDHNRPAFSSVESPQPSRDESAQDPGFIQTVPLPSLRVNSERLWNHLMQLASERSSELERQPMRDYLVQTLENAGWNVRQQRFTVATPTGEQQGINIIAELPELPALDAQSSQESTVMLPATASGMNKNTLLIGAHYDSVPGSPGADDNATGVAAVLELAQLLNPNDYRLPLKFVLFDLEEAGLLGSEAFVADDQERKEVKGAIIIEMLGYRCAIEGCQSYPPLPITPPSTVGDFLAVVGDRAYPELIRSFASDASTIPVYTLAVPTFGFMTPDLLRSDHVPFWKKGISAVMVTDTANFRNPNYHQASDRPETIDSAFFVAATQTTLEAITHLIPLLLDERG